MIYKSYLVEKNLNLLNTSLCLFFGENLGLKSDFKNKIKAENTKKEIVNLNQEEILNNSEFFFNDINNISLFEKKKIYFLNNTNDKILDLILEIQRKISDQKIYLFSEILDKRSKLRNHFENSDACGTVACYADNEITIKKLTLEKLKGFSGLSAQNINLIVNNSNNDRIKLNNEIVKITTFFQDKKITTDKLESLLDIRLNDDFNILKDVALIGNKVETNKLLSDTIIESEKNIFYINIINQRLYKLLELFKISDSKNFENFISKIKPPIFWKDKPHFIEQAKKWNSKKIKFVLEKTYSLELSIKTNATINKDILIKKLLVDICDLANA